MPGDDNVSMNKELLRWMNESKDKFETTKTRKKESKRPIGKCQICGQREAITVCLKCDRSVCKSCHFKLIGVCKKCIPKEIASKWDGSNPDWEKELGVEWIG